MEKKINLEEILDKSIYTSDINPGSKKRILYAMEFFGKQLLELAAENAEYTTEGNYDENLKIIIDKQSIIDTIKQVK